MSLHETGPIPERLAIFFIAAAVHALALFAVPLQAAESTVPPDLSGSWVLNEEESDDVLRKLEEARRQRRQGGMRGGGVRGGGRGGGGRNGGLFPPGALPPRGGGDDPESAGREGRPEGRGASAAHGLVESLMAPAMVIEHAEDRVVVRHRGSGSGSERVLLPGSGEVDDVAERGVRRSVVADWKDGALLVETKLQGQRGSTRSLETWRLSDDRSRLVVVLETSGGALQGLEIRRVYVREPSSEAPVELEPSASSSSDASEG